ncbi:hypothetical protein Salat_0596600 [Sesamum alatum]|uniref:Pectinesterase inhibitor domain-containing protein n=1 Tax=Sesamum alatum TaxID=300844 RepID=A0AAE1YRE2_9LAMI|nr:hypothetical protein Salat_0596600 [Sesamum alatum]
MSSRLFLLASISVALLWSYPALIESDSRADAQAVTQQAIAAAQAVIQVAKSVDSGGNRQTVGLCIETSSDAIDYLSQIKSLLPKADDRASIDTLKAKAAGALNDVGTCDDAFGASEPPQVAAATKKVQNLINQLLVILNNL